MKTLEDLKLKYNNLDKEAGKYIHPEFTEMYEIIAELIKDRNDVGDKGNFAFPLVTGSVIDEALTKLGFDKNKKFVSDFKKYREIEQKARDIQLEVMKHPEHSVHNVLNETKIKKSGNWRFVSISIIVPEFMLDIINQKISDDVKKVSGLYSVTTDIVIEDESDDDFLAIEAFGVRSSLEPYYRELQEYKIFETYFNYEDLKKYFLTMLLEIITYISNNTASPNKIRNRISSIIKEFDKLGGIGIIWQILILQGIVRWIENINISEKDYGYKELENLLNWVYKFLMEKLVFYSYYNWGDKELIYLEPLCNYLYSTEVGKEVQQGIFKDDEISRQTEDMRKLEELNSSEDIKDSPSISYIDKIKINTLKYGDGWANGKSGQIADLSNNYQLRFLETDENGLRFLQNEEEKIKLPIIACGFVAWLIKHWKEDTKTIFENYLKIRLNQYVDLHKNAPDAHKRDLEKDFFRNYLSQEEKWIKQSEAIFEFIQTNEADLIREYISNYYDYISQFIKLPYKVYKTFDEAIVNCSLEDRIFLHAYRKFCNPCNKPAFEVLNDILMIRSMHNTEPQKCFEYIKKNYNSSWKEYYIIMYMLKTTLDQASNFQIFIPAKIENTHPLIGFNKHLSETQKLLTDNSNSIGSTKEAINETTSNDPVKILKTVLMIKDDETVLKIYELMNNTLTNSNSKNFDLALFTCAFIEKKFLNSTFNKTNYHSMMKKSFGDKAGSRAKFNEKFNEINLDFYKEELKKCIQQLP